MISRKYALTAIALASLATAVATVQTVAQAEEAPVSSETLSTGITSDPFKFEVTGERKVLTRKAVVQPGASTGWHYHLGEEIATIQSGTFTRISGDDCKPRAYGPGESLVEPVGPDTVHMGINVGTEPVVLYVVDIIPVDAAAPSVPASDPGCPIPAK